MFQHFLIRLSSSPHHQRVRARVANYNDVWIILLLTYIIILRWCLVITTEHIITRVQTHFILLYHRTSRTFKYQLKNISDGGWWWWCDRVYTKLCASAVIVCWIGQWKNLHLINKSKFTIRSSICLLKASKKKNDEHIIILRNFNAKIMETKHP